MPRHERNRRFSAVFVCLAAHSLRPGGTGASACRLVCALQRLACALVGQALSPVVFECLAAHSLRLGGTGASACRLSCALQRMACALVGQALPPVHARMLQPCYRVERNPMHSSSDTNSRREFLSDSACLLLASGLPATLHAMAQESSGPGRLGPVSSVHRIIIDTDPGVDDALAILLALRSPELKVEAITAVAGNVPLELTLANALRLIEIAGRTDVPVAAGASSPLERRLVIADYFHGENGLAGVEFPEPVTRPVAEPASQLIRPDGALLSR